MQELFDRDANTAFMHGGNLPIPGGLTLFGASRL